MSWRDRLKGLLEAYARSSGGRELILIGVGNVLRGDDAAGVEIAQRLKSRLKFGRARIFVVEERVDLIPTLLREADPGLILIFDAADFAGGPGDVMIMTPAESSGKTISTHALPLELILRLAEVEAPAYIVGVQVSSLEIGRGMCQEVGEAVDEIVELIVGVLDSPRRQVI